MVAAMFVRHDETQSVMCDDVTHRHTHCPLLVSLCQLKCALELIELIYFFIFFLQINKDQSIHPSIH